MNTFEKITKCLSECEVDFVHVSDAEIVIPVPGFINLDKVFEISSMEEIGEKDLPENDFCSIHIQDDGDSGVSWTIVVGEDAEG